MASDCENTDFSHSACLTEMVTHPCKVCGKGLYCEVSRIKNHIRSSHDGMSPQEYKELPDYVGVISNPDKKIEASTYESFRIEADEISYSEKEGKYFSSKIGYGCLFKCKICHYETKSWRVLLVHYKGKIFNF